MNSSEYILSIKGIKKAFKDIIALNGVDIDIIKGEYVALLGPNGAGKTTLIEIAEGLQNPDEGIIQIAGLNWKGNENVLKRKIGISLQETRFIEKLTVKETLLMFSVFYGISRDKTDEVIELVDLKDKQKAYTVNLSGGQRQRLALGVALLNEPEILFLDEPTTGLDPAARREIWNILSNLKKHRKTTLVLTTHYMEEASFLCDRIIIMNEGKILTQGSLNQLLEDNDSAEIITLSSKEDLKAFRFVDKGLRKSFYDERNNKWNYEVDSIASSLPLLLNYANEKNIKIDNIESRKMTLDDLFIKLTGRKLEE